MQHMDFIICSFIRYHSIAYRTKSIAIVFVYFRSHGYETPEINLELNRVTKYFYLEFSDQIHALGLKVSCMNLSENSR